MKIPQRLSWGGITFITERTTQACRGWGSRMAQQEACFAHSGGNHPNSARIYTGKKRRARLCDGFSRTDTLPKKECAGRTRLMRKRIYARTKTTRTTLRLIEEADIHPRQRVWKREERAICQQSDPFFRPRRSDHYNPPSTSI